MKTLKINCALAIALLFWASAFVGIRIGLVDYSPGALALLRFLVASLCMGIIYHYLPQKRYIPWAIRWQLMIIGVAGIGVYNICLNIGEVTVSAGVASFVIGLIPVITLFLLILFGQEKPSLHVGLGIVVSFGGLFLMAYGEESPITFNSGIVIILISSLMGGIYNATQKHYLRDYHPVAITAWIMWGGTLLLLYFIQDLSHELFNASIKSTLAAIYMGIFPAAVAFVAWCYVLHYLPTSTASMYLYFLPILSTLLGFLVLHEQPSSLSMVGGMFALIGALIATRLDKVSKIFYQEKVTPIRSD